MMGSNNGNKGPEQPKAPQTDFAQVHETLEKHLGNADQAMSIVAKAVSEAKQTSANFVQVFATMKNRIVEAEREATQAKADRTRLEGQLAAEQALSDQRLVALTALVKEQKSTNREMTRAEELVSAAAPRPQAPTQSR